MLRPFFPGNAEMFKKQQQSYYINGHKFWDGLSVYPNTWHFLAQKIGGILFL